MQVGSWPVHAQGRVMEARVGGAEAERESRAADAAGRGVRGMVVVLVVGVDVGGLWDC